MNNANKAQALARSSVDRWVVVASPLRIVEVRGSESRVVVVRNGLEQICKDVSERERERAARENYTCDHRAQAHVSRSEGESDELLVKNLFSL